MIPEDALELPRLAGISGYELVAGRPVPVLSASRIQRSLITAAAFVLENHVRQNGLSGEVHREVGFVLRLQQDPDRLCMPDVAYVERTRFETNREPGRLLRCTPDLAIDIDVTAIEAWNRPGMVRKPGGPRRIAEYREAGTRLVWAIDSYTRTAMVHRADSTKQLVREDQMLDGEDVLPGFRLPLADLFDL